MTGVLFLSCRIYVLATTEGLGEPPVWVKACMVVSTVGLTLRVLLVLLLPLVINEKASFPTITGEYHDAHPVIESHYYINSKMYRLFFGMKCFFVVMIHGGSFGVVVGIFTIPSQTTTVSIAVIGTCILTTIYHSVVLCLYIARLFTRSLERHHDDKDYHQQFELSRQPFRRDTDRNFAAKAVSRKKLRGRVVIAVNAMSTTARNAPMLAVLFLIAQLRAEQLDPPYGMPTPTVQISFLIVIVAFFAEMVAAAFTTVVGREETAYYGFHFFVKAGIVGSIRYIFGGLVYAGLVPIYTSFFMECTVHGGAVPMTPTTVAVLLLAGLFFATNLGQWAIFLLSDAVKRNSLVWVRNVFLGAGVSIEFAPILGIAFLACKMRAMQITRTEGNPPSWAEDLMLMSVFATVLQMICRILMPVFVSAAADMDVHDEYELRSMAGAYVVTFVNYVASLAIHVCLFGQCVAIFTMTPETAQHGESVFHFLRYFKIVSLVCLIVLFSVFLTSARVIGLATKFAIESVHEDLIGVRIEVKNAKVCIFRGYVNVSGIKVFNPPAVNGAASQWSSDHLLYIDNAVVKLNMWKLISSVGKTFEVTTLLLNSLDVQVEKPSLKSTSNVRVSLARIRERKRSGKRPRRAEVLVRKISVQNIKGTVIHPLSKSSELSLLIPVINFDDFDTRKKAMGRATITTTISAILTPILQTAADSASRRLLCPRLTNSVPGICSCVCCSQSVTGSTNAEPSKEMLSSDNA
eukprot:TRINITY_DN67684_c0_g1_i1.p1 TRINITY_DN67684_c0_g1~~TRINITY_DN67684_c0_g1_i1.p1  ORF type:complete len:795 (-),score=76.91 TRINITY_DN67684_c0_g1_i1:108-2345(-)